MIYSQHLIRVGNIALALLAISFGCKTQQGTGALPESVTSATQANFVMPSGPNVMKVTVNGSLCMAKQYQNPNEPCVSVTICVPGTTTCQTIDGILLDSGSSGLRLFRSVVKIPLEPIATNEGGKLAECHNFLGGKSSWGEVMKGDIVLGGEHAVTTPIFLMDAAFSNPIEPCTRSKYDLDKTPEDSGFNGILGVSFHREDCGKDCLTASNDGNYYYFSCTDTSCVPTVPRARMTNPVSLLPKDNNGVVLALPQVPVTGAPSVTGALILGIGTRDNNTPHGVTVFPTRTFSTVLPAFGSKPINSGTIDSGSSKFYVPKIAALPVCAADAEDAATEDGMSCPDQLQTLSATMTSGSVSKTIQFQIGNADKLEKSGNMVFANYGRTVGTDDPYFMWGLPFFFGRSVYVGIDGAPSVLGKGPYWAF